VQGCRASAPYAETNMSSARSQSSLLALSAASVMAALGIFLGHALSQPSGLFHAAHFAQKLVAVGEPLAADYAFKADAAIVFLAQKTEQVDLVFIARRIVGVAALGGVGNVIAPIPDEKRFARPVPAEINAWLPTCRGSPSLRV